jgi:hypothetical protein
VWLIVAFSRLPLGGSIARLVVADIGLMYYCEIGPRAYLQFNLLLFPVLLDWHKRGGLVVSGPLSHLHRLPVATAATQTAGDPTLPPICVFIPSAIAAAQTAVTASINYQIG